MRFSKSGTVLAIVLAVTVFGGPSAYADDSSQVVIARDPSQTLTPESEPVNQSVDVTVQLGDTLMAIAEAHGTTIEAIVSSNSIADPNVIEVGTVLHINAASSDSPSNEYDQLRAAATAFITPPAPVVAISNNTVVNRSVGSAKTTSYVASSSAGNTYVWGTCTWYVKDRKPGIPNMLGNGGYGWLSTAAAAGYATGSSPAPGAIGVQGGHVVVVDAVNADGTVSISEMNYAGGVGVVHYRTVPASTFMYIYA